MAARGRLRTAALPSIAARSASRSRSLTGAETTARRRTRGYLRTCRRASEGKNPSYRVVRWTPEMRSTLSGAFSSKGIIPHGPVAEDRLGPVHCDHLPGSWKGTPTKNDCATFGPLAAGRESDLSDAFSRWPTNQADYRRVRELRAIVVFVFRVALLPGCLAGEYAPDDSRGNPSIHTSSATRKVR